MGHDSEHYVDGNDVVFSLSHSFPLSFIFLSLYGGNISSNQGTYYRHVAFHANGFPRLRSPVTFSLCTLALLLFVLHRLSFLPPYAGSVRVTHGFQEFAHASRTTYVRERSASFPDDTPATLDSEGCRRVVVDSSDTIKALVAGYFTEGRDLMRERGLSRVKTPCLRSSLLDIGSLDCRSLDLLSSVWITDRWIVDSWTVDFRL